jgi:DNA-binding transcriptional MerR regulator
MTTLLTIKEIAKQLQVPESNIRYYRDRFEEYIPSVGEGRRKRYKREAVDVFGHIVQGYRDEKSTEQIAAELAELYPRTLPVAHELSQTAHGVEGSYDDQSTGLHSNAHPLLQVQARTLEHLAQTLAESSSLQSEYSRFRDEHEKLKKGLVYLWRTRNSRDSNDGTDLDVLRDTLTQQVYTLEQRLVRLESHVDREFGKIRSEVKELLDLTRELITRELIHSGEEGGPEEEN